jgi:flagellar hook protein FlgE
MQIPPAVLSGLAAATRRFDASAQRTARAGEASGDVDLAVEAVEQISAEHAFSANLSVLRTSDEMFKRLLDIKV